MRALEMIFDDFQANTDSGLYPCMTKSDLPDRNRDPRVTRVYRNNRYVHVRPPSCGASARFLRFTTSSTVRTASAFDLSNGLGFIRWRAWQSG